jgi:hypothetical protein
LLHIPHSLEGCLDFNWGLNAPLGRTDITGLEVPVSRASGVDNGVCRCSGNGKEQGAERKEVVHLKVLHFGQSDKFEESREEISSVGGRSSCLVRDMTPLFMLVRLPVC